MNVRNTKENYTTATLRIDDNIERLINLTHSPISIRVHEILKRHLNRNSTIGCQHI